MTTESSEPRNRLISMSEAAELYGFSAKYLGNLAKRGRLKAQKIGGAWITTPGDVEDYIRSRRKMGVYREDIKLD